MNFDLPFVILVADNLIGISDNIGPRVVLNQIDDGNAEEIANAPTYNADRQAFGRYKKNNLPNYPTNPVDLNDIELPEFLLETLKTEGKGDLFLMYDSGAVVNEKDKILERFMVFGTDQNTHQLENAHCYADGTFDVAPLLFLQVYTIHALVLGRCLPMIYGILSRKTQTMYESFLSVIRNKISRPPKSITSDFEKAFLNAVKTVFPSIVLFGCFFHFKQNMFRKIQELGLAFSYTSDERIRKLLKLPQVLAYVPIADISELFKELKNSLTDEDTEILKFYDYFEEYYIGNETTITKGNEK